MGYPEPYQAEQFAQMLKKSKDYISAYDGNFWSHYCFSGEKDEIKEALRLMNSSHASNQPEHTRLYILQKSVDGSSCYVIGSVGWGYYPGELFLWRGKDSYFKSLSLPIKGTMTLSLIAFLFYNFKKEKDLKKVKVVVDRHNDTMIRLAEKVGFVKNKSESLKKKNSTCRKQAGTCLYNVYELTKTSFYGKIWN